VVGEVLLAQREVLDRAQIPPRIYFDNPVEEMKSHGLLLATGAVANAQVG
jgi:hypothetical protein